MYPCMGSGGGKCSFENDDRKRLDLGERQKDENLICKDQGLKTVVSSIRGGLHSHRNTDAGHF